MIPWPWLIVALFTGSTLGVLVFAIIVSGKAGDGRRD
jgi:hypothetical protein